MATIDALVTELNYLSIQYVDKGIEFEHVNRLQEVIGSIKELGYHTITPPRGLELSEFEFRFEKIKQDFLKMMNIQTMKIEAIDNQEFEQAAGLRDIERELDNKIRTNLSLAKELGRYKLTAEKSISVQLEDPETILITLLK